MRSSQLVTQIWLLAIYPVTSGIDNTSTHSLDKLSGIWQSPPAAHVPDPCSLPLRQRRRPVLRTARGRAESRRYVPKRVRCS